MKSRQRRAELVYFSGMKYPRSPKDTVGGIVYFGRMIDKIETKDVIFALVEDMETIAVHVLIGREATIFELLPVASEGISKK